MNTQRFLDLVRIYTDIKELTFEIATAFINKILIKEPEGTSRWDRRNNIVIEYRFIGSIPTKDEPAPSEPVGPKVRDFLMENDRITNANICELTDMTTQQATGYLRKLCDSGVLTVGGRKTCGRFYLRTVPVDELDKISV